MGKFFENQLLWRLGMALKNKINKNLKEISHKQPTHTPDVQLTTICYYSNIFQSILCDNPQEALFQKHIVKYEGLH
jgi:hypothetical protein